MDKAEEHKLTFYMKSLDQEIIVLAEREENLVSVNKLIDTFEEAGWKLVKSKTKIRR